MEGWYLSVFAAGECEGVTLRGVEYPLTGARLSPSMPIGVSNEFSADTARIEVARGTLIVIASRREAPGTRRKMKPPPPGRRNKKRPAVWRAALLSGQTRL